MIIEILLLLLLLLCWAYYAVTRQFGYFQQKGIPFAQPAFPFGSRNMKKVILQKVPFNRDIAELADNEFKGVKVFGYFSFGQPTWVINDEELAKLVLIKDFDHFVDEVNDKLKPPGVPLRKIYTSKGGTEVKSLSDLTPNKEYMASPSKFKKKKKKKTSTDQGSASSDKGYHSSDETRNEPNSHPSYG